MKKSKEQELRERIKKSNLAPMSFALTPEEKKRIQKLFPKAKTSPK